MNPIGVFDSGIGGLSILRALHTELPLERFVYVADSAHNPYGERDEAHIEARSMAITRYLIEQHRIKALVIACNTATAAAVHIVRAHFPALPIIGLEPALKPAAQLSQTKIVGVMATRGTLQSAKFRHLLESLADQAHFIPVACDGLAAAIEADDAIKIKALCADYTGVLAELAAKNGAKNGIVDTLVLGCTHYPLVADVLKMLVGDKVTLVEAGIPVARQTRRLLADRNQLATAMPTEADIFISTGAKQPLEGAVKRWLNPPKAASFAVSLLLI
jgi:glutamate racemase